MQYLIYMFVNFYTIYKHLLLFLSCFTFLVKIHNDNVFSVLHTKNYILFCKNTKYFSKRVCNEVTSICDKYSFFSRIFGNGVKYKIQHPLEETFITKFVFNYLIHIYCIFFFCFLFKYTLSSQYISDLMAFFFRPWTLQQVKCSLICPVFSCLPADLVSTGKIKHQLSYHPLLSGMSLHTMTVSHYQKAPQHCP